MNRKQRRLEKKQAKSQAARSRQPASVDIGAAMNEAVRHHQEGRLDLAGALYERVLQSHPGQSDALNLLGAIALQTGDNQKAADLIGKALIHRPEFPEALTNLGTAKQNLDEREEAVSCFQKALALSPGFAQAHFNLGNLFRDMGRLDEAVASFRHAIALDPAFVEALGNMGNVLRDLGRLDEAIATYEKALSRKPDYLDAHTNILTTEQCRPGITAAKLFDLHLAWDKAHAEPVRHYSPTWTNSADSERTIRIGLVSPDLGRHPIGYYMAGLIENHLQEEMEIYCYSDRVPDDMSERLKHASDGWRDTGGLSDGELATLIADDGIDILFDLAGHTAGNRILLFIRRLAPLQVTWAGYVGTTGLKEMDFLLSDAYSTPADEDLFYRETILRMPDSWLCYEPPEYMPEVGALPRERNGVVTFGSFNNPAKINDEVLSLWARVLSGVPDSRLILKYKGIECDGNRDRIFRIMKAQGIDQSRLVLEGAAPHAELLACYNDVDIALDTFPYNGGVTTCEALWMGVPVITLVGTSFAGRHSLSFLSTVGHSELVARDAESYVELAQSLASEQTRLSELRRGMRGEMRTSPLCDGPRFAANFADAMRGIWRTWCTGQDERVHDRSA